jgi:hypothetical protein
MFLVEMPISHMLLRLVRRHLTQSYQPPGSTTFDEEDEAESYRGGWYLPWISAFLSGAAAPKLGSGRLVMARLPSGVPIVSSHWE